MFLTTAPALRSHVAVSFAQLASGKHHRSVDQLKRNRHLGRLRQRSRGCVKLVDCCCGEFILNSQLIMIFLLFILCLTPEVTSSKRCTDQSPFVVQPFIVTIEDKSPLEISCSIRDTFQDKYKAKDLYFLKNNQKYNSTSVYFKLVSEHQANLSIPIAYEEIFKGHIRCWVNNLNKSCLFDWMTDISADVIFRRKPLKPSFNYCAVENWERLKCVWEPTLQEQTNYTLTSRAKHSFIYRFVYSKVSHNIEGLQHECSNKSMLNETCILYADREDNGFQMGSVYELFIHAMTDLGHQEITTWKEQFNEYFNTSEHVKPNPVEKLRFDSATGLLSWKRPSSTWNGARNMNLIYNVTYRTNWNKIATTCITSENMINLSTPYTKYQVNVSVKPVIKGSWSDFSSLHFETEETAPTVNPEISVLGYEYYPDCTDHCKAFVYWQPIKASEQHAANLQYVVLQRTKSQQLKRQLYDDHAANHVVKKLPKEGTVGWIVVKNITGYNHSFTEIDVTSDMEITIITQNDVGVNKISERSIFIMKKEHLLPVTEGLVIEGYSNARTNISVSFEELPSEINSTSYVLFWADKKNEKLIGWQVLPTENGTFTWNVSLEKDYRAYKYGLGKIQNQANSGIQWSTEPSYAYEGLAPPPIYIKPLSVHSKSVTLKWDMPPVKDEDGHIICFLIQYCSWDNSTMQCTEDHVKHKQVPGTFRSVTLSKLSHSTQYIVSIRSVTRSGRSVNSKTIYVTTGFGFTAGIISGIVIAAIIVVIIIGGGCYIWYKKIKQARKWYHSGVKVQLPEKKDFAQNSEDSDTYNRSISINSMDSGLSLDDGIYHEEMCGYARTGYISPTPLRSIPEDADIDEVSLTGIDSINGEGFIQTYKVTPGQPSGGYLSNNTTGSSMPSQGHDSSRSAISKYAAITLHEQSEAEQPVEKCSSVTFVTGQDVVRLGSDERTPSPESGCTYIQIQPDPKVTKKSQNPFSRAFWNANRAKMNNPMQGTCSGCVLDSGKTRKIPRYGKHRHYDGSFKRKAAVSGMATTLSKRPTEYVANDGTFNPSAVLKVPPGYVANDGTFNPSAGADPVSAYVANDGTFDPSLASKSTSNDPSDYVANDGSFDPTTASKLPNGYVPNDGSFDPKTASHLSSDYVPNDGSFDPKTASNLQNDYVSNDELLDPKTASNLQSNYVPNDGSFDPKTASNLQSDYVPNDGSFDPKTASNLQSDYVPNDGSFDPKTASNLQSDYVPNDGSFNPSAVSEDVTLLPEPTTSNVQCPKLSLSKNCLNEGFFPDTKLYDSTTKVNELNCKDSTDTALSADYNSGYVPHDVAFAFGSVNSLNHRLSAVDTDHVDDDCFDDVEPQRQDLDSQASSKMKPDSDACLNESSPSTSCQGCSVVQTADKHRIPQQQDVDDAHEKPGVRLRSKPGKTSQVTLSKLDAMALAHDAALLEHGKNTPNYVNMQPHVHTAPNCNVPRTLSSVSRQCGGFVREVRPSPDHEHGDLDGMQTSGKRNQQEPLSLDAEAVAKQNGTPEAVFDKNVNNGTLPNNELSHDNVKGVRDDVRKQNGVIPSQTNGIVRRCAAMDIVSDMPNGAALCGSPSSKSRHSYSEGEMASRNENNNITKSDYCRHSSIVNSSGMPASAEVGSYVQAPLV